MVKTASLYAHENASSYLAFVTHMDNLYEHKKENPDEIHQRLRAKHWRRKLEERKISL